MGHITHLCDASARNPPQGKLTLFMRGTALIGRRNMTLGSRIQNAGPSGSPEWRFVTGPQPGDWRLQPILLPLRLRYLLLEHHFLVHRCLLGCDVAIDSQHFLVG